MAQLGNAVVAVRPRHVVVLGPAECGAVKAALDTKLQAAQQRSRIQILVDDIMPGLADLDPQLPAPRSANACVSVNRTASSGQSGERKKLSH